MEYTSCLLNVWIDKENTLFLILAGLRKKDCKGRITGDQHGVVVGRSSLRDSPSLEIALRSAPHVPGVRRATLQRRR
jgi:hypothetical protein